MFLEDLEDQFSMGMSENTSNGRSNSLATWDCKSWKTLSWDEEANASKNEGAFAELIQFLDDKSLALVMRDTIDDGRKALQILRAHYAGTGKPRVISLYTELTSLVRSANESVTDYVIRVETAATALENA